MGKGEPSGRRGAVRTTAGRPHTQRAAMPTTPLGTRPSCSRRASTSEEETEDAAAVAGVAGVAGVVAVSEVRGTVMGWLLPILTVLTRESNQGWEHRKEWRKRRREQRFRAQWRQVRERTASGWFRPAPQDQQTQTVSAPPRSHRRLAPIPARRRTRGDAHSTLRRRSQSRSRSRTDSPRRRRRSSPPA